MKFSLRIVTILFLIAMLFSLYGCQQDVPEATDAVKAVAPATQQDAAALYTQAAQQVLSAHNVTMQLELQTDMQVGDELFSKTSSQTLSVMNQGTDYMIASLEEALTVGQHSAHISERYSDGMQYCTINGTRFVSPITAQAYLERFIPGMAFDTALYGSIQADQSESGLVILFGSAAAAEAWAIPANSSLQSAEGQAYLNGDGQLLECVYSVRYTCGDAAVEHTVKISYDTTTLPSIDVPSSAEGSVPLTDPRVPRLLEEVCGYLTQTRAISAQTVHTITSEAFGITRTQTSLLNLYDHQGLMALRESTVELLNLTQGEEATQTVQTELFADGRYTLTTGTDTASDHEEISEEQMLSYCRALLVSTVLLPESITAVTVSQDGNIYRLDFTGSEALAQLIGTNACKTLYDDPNLLNDLASEYRTDEITAYLEVDVCTGLPIAAGIHYSGTHTIQQTAYLLSSYVDQVYTPVHPEAYEVILQATTPIETESTEAAVSTEVTVP